MITVPRRGIIPPPARSRVFTGSKLTGRLVLAVLLLGATTGTGLGQLPPRSGVPLDAGSAATNSAAAHPPLITFVQKGSHISATIDQRMFASDFVLRAEVAKVTRAGEAVGAASLCSASTPGTRLATGALQLRREHDSLVMMEYAGALRGQLQYRRRGAMPVLGTTASGALVVDAEPLLTAIERGTTRTAPTAAALLTSFAMPTPGATERCSRAALLPSQPGASVVRPLRGATVVYHVSVQRLPARPMRPRLYDPRLTFVSRSAPSWSEDTAAGDQDRPSVQYICRRHLEKKDPTAPVSDVVHPIIFRLTSSIPERLVPIAKHAIEEWNAPFEAIGFRHAVVVRLPTDPPAANNGDSPELESEVHWEEDDSAGYADADLDHVDPRTCEILDPKIVVRSGLLKNILNAYVGLAGLNDPRSLVPISDSLELLGNLLVKQLQHEVGHTLGLFHNFRDDMYPTDSLRRLTFVRRMGSGSTVMGYTAFNYIAQQEDGLSPVDLRMRIGPYDQWMLAWGYRPIPDAATPEAELPTLERWRAVQDTTPYLQPSLPDLVTPGLDPYESEFVIGDDILKSAEYALRNTARLLKYYLGKDIEHRPFRILANYWCEFVKSVPALLGGATPQAPYPKERVAVKLQPIDSVQQVAAIRFVLARMFYGQDDLIKQVVVNLPPGPSTLNLFDSLIPSWTKSQAGWRQQQQIIMEALLDEGKLQRLATDPSQPRVLPVLCQELTPLERQLAAASADAAVPERQAHAATLDSMVKKVLDPAAGYCH